MLGPTTFRRSLTGLVLRISAAVAVLFPAYPLAQDINEGAGLPPSKAAKINRLLAKPIESSGGHASSTFGTRDAVTDCGVGVGNVILPPGSTTGALRETTTVVKGDVINVCKK